MTASPRKIFGLSLLLVVASLTVGVLAQTSPTLVSAQSDHQRRHHPTPSPTPTASPTPTPASTSPPTPTPTPTPPSTPSPNPTATATPSTTPTSTPTSALWPVTSLHYTANGNFSSSGQYLPGADGFNLADVSSVGMLNSLPAAVHGLVWIGYCGGADSVFQTMVSPFIGDPKLFGFYVIDEPFPSGCPATNLKAEDDWIHAHVPGAKAFAVLDNQGPATAPAYGWYTPANSDLDLVGLDPYPVRSELSSPDYNEIAKRVTAAEAAGWPLSSLVPVYQAFGGGTQTDDAGGQWVLPTAAQEDTILADWAAVVPTPVFDYAFSWGSQSGDAALSQAPTLQSIFLAKNTGS
jgi:hypothetical protein